GVVRWCVGAGPLRQAQGLEPGFQQACEFAVRGKGLSGGQVSCLVMCPRRDKDALPIELVHGRFRCKEAGTKGRGSAELAQNGLCEEVEPMDVIDSHAEPCWREPGRAQ